MTAAFPPTDPPFPIRDFERDLTGLLRDMTIRIDTMTSTRSESGALGAALALMSVLLGRKVESPTGFRTNLYVIGTAASGAGKSSAMNAMKDLATEAGIDDRIGATDVSSGVAILQELADSIVNLLCVDEFGDVLRRALHPRAASHERDIARVLKDIFSASAGVYRGKAYAGGRRADLVQPHLSLYGVSTHEALWEGIDGASMSDGLLARFLLIPIGNTQPQKVASRRYDEVMEGVRAIINFTPPGNLGGHGRPVVAAMADGLTERWMADRLEWQRYSRRAEIEGRVGAPAIINRIHEMTIKIAMISAAGRSLDNLVITAEDYDLGSAIAHWSAISILNAIARYHVENANHRDLKRILAFIEAAGVEGRTKRQITRRFQGIFAKGRDGDNILGAILEAGSAAIFRLPSPAGPSGGRPSEVVVASEFAADFVSIHGGEQA